MVRHWNGYAQNSAESEWHLWWRATAVADIIRHHVNCISSAQPVICRCICDKYVRNARRYDSCMANCVERCGRGSWMATVTEPAAPPPPRDSVRHDTTRRPHRRSALTNLFMGRARVHKTTTVDGRSPQLAFEHTRDGAIRFVVKRASYSNCCCSAGPLGLSSL